MGGGSNVDMEGNMTGSRILGARLGEYNLCGSSLSLNYAVCYCCHFSSPDLALSEVAIRDRGLVNNSITCITTYSR